MQLSPHFSRSELEFSEAAAREGFPNICPDELLPRLADLAQLLESARSCLSNRAVYVNSGYRCPAANKAVGGAPDSAHMQARAADIRVAGLTPRQVATMLVDSKLSFDKLILEFDRWVHLQNEKPGTAPRRAVYTAIKNAQGQTQYIEGIVS